MSVSAGILTSYLAIRELIRLVTHELSDKQLTSSGWAYLFDLSSLAEAEDESEVNEHIREIYVAAVAVELDEDLVSRLSDLCEEHQYSLFMSNPDLRLRSNPYVQESLH